jgi:outer membrane protein assembly factor BamE (lipoprotein component of BamABCDE complex)
MPIRKISSLVRPGAAAFIALAACGFAASCTPSIDRRGYIPDETEQQALQSGVDTKSTVLSRYGSPSTIAPFDPNAWYYISDTKERRTYHKPVTTQRTVIAVKFDDKDVVSQIKTYSLADGRVVNYSDRTTPTRGRELSVIEQIFGNVGRGGALARDDNEIGSNRR